MDFGPFSGFGASKTPDFRPMFMDFLLEVLPRHDPVRPEDGQHAEDPARGHGQLLEAAAAEGRCFLCYICYMIYMLLYINACIIHDES